ncbi:MAG: class I SAM-dependent methyltransferase [Reichenbachiella sp.]
MSNLHTTCLINRTEDLVELKGFEKTDLVKSKSSGLVFARKIPTPQELQNHYNNYSRGGGRLTGITIKRYNTLLDEFEPYRANNRILEIGCGGGAFLLEAQKRGWEVHGTEYTKEAADIPESQGVAMKHGILQPSNYVSDFDIIVSIEVIEHINNPLEEVTNMYSLLRNGGLLYITTPNFNAIERYHLGEEYKVIGYPEHLIYFTPKTLNLLMKKVGFKKKKLLTTGINISSFRSKKQRASEGRQGGVKNSDQELREHIEGNNLLQIVKNIINNILTILQIGNAIKAYYIKP